MVVSPLIGHLVVITLCYCAWTGPVSLTLMLCGGLPSYWPPCVDHMLLCMAGPVSLTLILCGGLLSYWPPCVDHLCYCAWPGQVNLTLMLCSGLPSYHTMLLCMARTGQPHSNAKWWSSFQLATLHNKIRHCAWP